MAQTLAKDMTEQQAKDAEAAAADAEQRYNETITIPLFPDMTDDMVDFVISRVKAIGEKYHA